VARQIVADEKGNALEFWFDRADKRIGKSGIQPNGEALAF
jgi:hypothetical protein